eukprot:scaffold7149_cov308-Prasinococcus_capsulatus_cf.AAC.2
MTCSRTTGTSAWSPRMMARLTSSDGSCSSTLSKRRSACATPCASRCAFAAGAAAPISSRVSGSSGWIGLIANDGK